MVQMTFDDFISTGYTFPGTGGTLVLTISENADFEEFDFRAYGMNYSIVSVTATENGDEVTVTEISSSEYYMSFLMGGEAVEIIITVGPSPTSSDESEAFQADYRYVGYYNTVIVGQLGKPDSHRWVEVTSDFDRSLPFTKIRWDLSKSAGWAIVNNSTANGALSEIPGINTDGKAWNQVSGSTSGYAGQNRFTLRAPSGGTNGFVFSCRALGFTDRSMITGSTQISENVYEYEYPVTMYWGGIGANTGPYNNQDGTGVYVYVEYYLFEVSPTAITTSYTGGTTAITVTADSDITWTASTSGNWFSLSTSSGTGNANITVTISQNPTYQNRNGSITFTSSMGDEIVVSITQEKSPVLVYDHPIYRSGSIVKKMYRSGNLIYYRLNPPTQ